MRQSTTTVRYITFHDKKRATINGWEVNHRLHVQCEGSMPHILWVPVLVLVASNHQEQHITHKCICLLIHCRATARKDQWEKKGLNVFSMYGVYVFIMSMCFFVCVPLRLVSSGTPAAAAGSHNLGRQKSEQPWQQTDTPPSCSVWQSSGRPPPW